MSLAVNFPSHDNTVCTSTNTRIDYTISYTYSKIDVDDNNTDIVLVTAWKSPYTNDSFINYSTITHRVTSAKLSTYEEEIETKRQAQQTACENYLNTLIGNVTLPDYTKSRDVTSTVNGITYTVSVALSVQNIGGNAESTYDSTSANINATIKWKTKGSKFAYEDYFEGTLLTVTAETYTEYYNTNKEGLITTIDNKINNDLVPKVLNKLIGIVKTPAKVETNFKSEDGLKTVYVRTTVTGANSVQNATGCTLYCTTVEYEVWYESCS